MRSMTIWETVAIGVYNFNYGPATSRAEADELVKGGDYRWAFCLGGVLSLVPKDYELKEWESWVVTWA